MGSNDKARGWSKAQWNQWYTEQRQKHVTAKSRDHEQDWTPSTLGDVVDVTVGSRLVANQLAAQMHRDHPSLSFQECVARVFDQHPALYETEIAASQHATQATYDGRSLT